MSEGVDYSFSRPGGAALQAAGKTFAGRYLWHNTNGSKGLSKAEHNDLVAHGVSPFHIYEEDGKELLGGHASGVAIAQKAEAARVANGLPAGTIDFCVDFDATPAQQAAINDALVGAASVIGHDRTGLYAGFWVVKRAFDAGVIAHGFQTYAWSGGNWDPRAAVQQYNNGQTINGASVDLCRGVVPVAPGASAPAPSAPAAGGGSNPFGIGDVRGLQKIAAKYGGNTTPDNIFGNGSKAGFAQFLRQNWGYSGNDVLGPIMWASIARWLRSKWGYVGNDIPGPVMRAALQRASDANFKAL
jgi:hypothetical protein